MAGMRRGGIFLAALALDTALGDAPTPLHPVGWLGRVASILIRIAPRHGKRSQTCYGLSLTIVIPLLWAYLNRRPLDRLRPRHSMIAWLVEAALLKSTFTVTGLSRAAGAVRTALVAQDRIGAQASLRSLVSRPTLDLSPELMVSATVESVAENIGDSFLAPWLYYALFGLPGAAAYRAANTLDSMIGYRGPYEHLGKAAARLDDVLNYLPARLAAILTVASARLSGASARGAWHCLQRDRARTESPNAGWPMSAMAGALGVRLEKVGYYSLGEAKRALRPERISEAVNLMRAVASTGAAATLALIGARYAVFSRD